MTTKKTLRRIEWMIGGKTGISVLLKGIGFSQSTSTRSFQKRLPDSHYSYTFAFSLSLSLLGPSTPLSFPHAFGKRSDREVIFFLTHILLSPFLFTVCSLLPPSHSLYQNHCCSTHILSFFLLLLKPIALITILSLSL